MGNWPYTIEAWVKPNRNPRAWGIVGWGEYGVGNRVNAFRFVNNQNVVNYWWGNDLFARSGFPALDDGKWHHVAATWDQTTRRIFLDGKRVVHSAARAPAVGSKDTFCVGKTNDNEYFKGLVQDDASEKNNCCGSLYNNQMGTCYKQGEMVTRQNHTTEGGCSMNWCARDERAMVSTRHILGQNQRLFRFAADWALIEDSEARTIVQEFANDNAAFLASFAKSWDKLIRKGSRTVSKCSRG